MPPRSKSISFVVALALVVTTTIVLGAFAFFNYRTERGREIRELRSEQSVLADQLAASLALPVWNFDRAQIDKIIEGAMRNEDVFAVVVRLAGVDSTIKGLVRNTVWKTQAINREPTAVGLLEETRKVVADGETVGTLELFATPRLYQARLQRELASMVLNIALFDALLVALLYLLLRRLVIRPIEFLETRATAIGAGRDETPVASGGRFPGELETLRVALDEMFALLRDRYEALRLSEEKFARAFHGNPAAIVITRMSDGMIIEANEAFAERYGSTREAMKDKSVFDVGVWQEPGKREGIVDRLRAEKSIRDLERTAILPDGSKSETLVSIQLMQIHGEECLVTVSRDITALKRTERALRESETKFRTLFETANDAIFLMNERVFLSCNGRTLVMFGCQERDIIGRSPVDFSPAVQPDGRPSLAKARERIEAAFAGKPQLFEWRHNRLDGTPFDAEVSLNRVELSGALFLQAIVRDVTQRKKAEAQLRASEERLDLAVRGSTDGLWDWDVRTDEVYYAPRFRELLGYDSPAEFRPTVETFKAHLHTDDRDRVWATIREHLDRRKPYDVEYRLCTRGGKYRWFRARGQAIWNEAGEAVRMAGSITDVTDRKEAEHFLRESEERYRTVVEFSPECVAVSVDDVFVYVNPAGAKMAGANDVDEVVGRSVYDFIPPELHETIRERRRGVLKDRVPARPAEYPILRLDGGQVVTEAVAVPFVYAGRPAILSLIRDITERKRAEAEKEQAIAREQQAHLKYTLELIASQEAERKRIAGELHDSLGQNLLLVKNYLQQAMSSGPDLRAAREQLESASQAASQAITEVRHISHDLRPYQLDQLGFTRALDVMIESAAGSTGIAITRKLDRADDVINGEAAINLYRVAQESLNNIVKHSGARNVRIVLERDVRHVLLTIEDDGRGFARPLEDRDFPNGLGLRNIAERVRIIGGTLRLDSSAGRGTRIEVVIPVDG